MTMFHHLSLPHEPFLNPRPAPAIPISRPQPIPEYPHNLLDRRSGVPSRASGKLWQAARVERAYKPSRKRETRMERSRSRMSTRSDLVEAKAHFHQAGRDFKIALGLAVSVVKSFPSVVKEKRKRRRSKASEALHRRKTVIVRMDVAF